MSDLELSDLRENITVDCIGHLFGRPVYTDPFDYPEERGQYIHKIWQALGVKPWKKPENE